MGKGSIYYGGESCELKYAAYTIPVRERDIPREKVVLREKE